MKHFIQIKASGNFLKKIDANQLAEVCARKENAKAYKTEAGAARAAAKYATEYPDMFRAGFQVVAA